MWWKIYESLNLFGGTLNFIGDDLEDMIEIRYPDDMLIDVGKYDDIYCIIVVLLDDQDGWQHLLLELPVADKKDLYRQYKRQL
ncbi:MAG: hypothetical protein Q4D37_10960 [Oscillospiraceae bacterium]|nr:hypothetical protein [Oscillospiraceae bacterium]